MGRTRLQLVATEGSSSAAVAFVDLAGSSAIADLFGDAAALKIIDQFADLVRSAIEGQGEVVKWIGDEAMLSFPDATKALVALGRLIPSCRAVPEIPLTRTGIHLGPVMHRNGDIFGSTVNIASRIAALASAGHVLASQPVAEIAGALGISSRELGAVGLRSVAEPVTLHTLDLSEEVDPVWVDPVCKMLAPYAAFSRTDAGPWFCSDRCREAFRASPATYLAASASVPG